MIDVISSPKFGRMNFVGTGNALFSLAAFMITSRLRYARSSINLSAATGLKELLELLTSAAA